MSPNENPHVRTIRINISKPIIDNSNDLLENMDIFLKYFFVSSIASIIRLTRFLNQSNKLCVFYARDLWNNGLNGSK